MVTLNTVLPTGRACVLSSVSTVAFSILIIVLLSLLCCCFLYVYYTKHVAGCQAYFPQGCRFASETPIKIIGKRRAASIAVVMIVFVMFVSLLLLLVCPLL